MNTDHLINNFGSIGILSMLFTLMLYHLFVYLGRKDAYYLHFSLFLTSLMVFIFTCMDIRFLLINPSVDTTLIPPLNAISFAGMLYYVNLVYRRLFNNQDESLHVYYPTYILLGTLVFLSFTSLINSNFYTQFMAPLNGVLGILCLFYILFKHIRYLIKTGLIGDKQVSIVLLTSMLFWLELFIEVGHVLFNFSYPFKDYYILTGITTLAWAYILSNQFNNEFYELSELKLKLESRVLERTKEIQKVNKEKEQSYINLAHETKTPLTLINNYLNEYINNHGLENEMIVVKKNIDHLNEVIQNYFNKTNESPELVSKDSTKIVNLSSFLNTQVALFQKHYKNKHIEFKTNIREDLHIKANFSYTEQLINNLTESSLKLLPNSSVLEITVNQTKNYINIFYELSDFTLPKEEHVHVFEPLFLSTYFNNTDYTSSGIGLSMTQKIIESLKGSITFSGSDNRSYFHIMLPLAEASQGQKDTSEKPNNNSSKKHIKQSKGKLLLVDDSDEMIFFLIQKLQNQYDLTTARNGLDALEKLTTIKRPDLIISDIMMDGMDGITFYKELRNNNKLNAVPFIFLTAKSSKHEALQGLETGAVDYITKPFVFRELQLKIEAIISQHQRFKDNMVKSALRLISDELDGPYQEDAATVQSNHYKDFGLTAREIDITQEIQHGNTNKQIANKLHIAETTVAKHISNIFEKTGVKNRVDLLNKVGGK